MEAGSKQMDCAVMDGSAVVILGKLPNFARINRNMNHVPRMSERQYIIRASKSRKFIEILLISLNTDDCNG